MSYMHIENLYKARDILAFKKCYALEKIHGTSAHVSWNKEKVSFFSGGSDYNLFVSLFNVESLEASFRLLGHDKVVVYGESYGGKVQKMSHTYGKDMKFIAFEVKIGESWLSVPDAEAVVKHLGIEFVHYDLIPATIETIDAIILEDSIQAIRNGMGSGHKREGVVLRPPFEVRKNNDERVIAKHKRADFQEIKSPRPLDQEKLAVLEDAQAVAEEWVTDMRLTHILDAFPSQLDITMMGDVIRSMIEDIMREATDEIVDSHEVRKAIGKKTAKLFKNRFKLMEI